MRAILLLLILVVVGLIAAVATGFLSINQVRPAQAPDIAASGNGIAAQGGQAPKFDVDTGSLSIGTGQATIPVPQVQVQPADGKAGQQQQQQGAANTTNATQP